MAGVYLKQGCREGAAHANNQYENGQINQWGELAPRYQLISMGKSGQTVQCTARHSGKLVSLVRREVERCDDRPRDTG
jgi:hypothetical protein